MQWPTRDTVVKRSPRPGEHRIIKRFAWIPTSLDDHNTVWLEMYFVHQEYSAYSPAWQVEDYAGEAEWIDDDTNYSGLRAWGWKDISTQAIPER